MIVLVEIMPIVASSTDIAVIAYQAVSDWRIAGCSNFFNLPTVSRKDHAENQNDNLHEAIQLEKLIYKF